MGGCGQPGAEESPAAEKCDAGAHNCGSEVVGAIGLANLSFDANVVDGYVYQLPAGWSSDCEGCETIVVQNGNVPWGELSSGTSANFLSIHVAPDEGAVILLRACPSFFMGFSIRYREYIYGGAACQKMISSSMAVSRAPARTSSTH